VTLVSQTTHLFNATVRANLRLAAPEASEDELRAALEAVGMLPFVDSLPDGLDTYTGEHGTRLSGGQGRRLTVARALLRDAPVVVLDEPTEGLDTETQASMMRALQVLMEGRTVLLITHRLVGLERMDQILVLEAGRIIERGTHQELMSAQTRYASLMSRLP
jgi:ATP-binding cassette subfamily C protein CydC